MMADGQQIENGIWMYENMNEFDFISPSLI